MTDDPRELATIVASLPKPLLVGSDVDGTLSEITEAPDASTLVPGAVEALLALQARGCEVAVVSGRPMHDLVVQFGMPSSLHLIGSHGAERGADAAQPARTPLESTALAAVTLALEAIAAEHDGAWVETKPFGSALHVRRCTPEVGERALLAGRGALVDLEGVRLFDGHMVLEATVRATSKRLAMGDLRDALRPATTIYVGDDASDEGVFEALSATDIGVKIGPGVTLATHRLAGPRDATDFLATLASLL